MELVFVYGTLRRGASNAFRMEGAEFLGEKLVRGRLYKVDWYPGLVVDNSAGWVAGELWRVSPTKLLELDDFEGVAAGSRAGEEYRRTLVSRDSLNCSDDDQDEGFWVWEWIKPVEGLELIHSGDWLLQNPDSRA